MSVDEKSQIQAFDRTQPGALEEGDDVGTREETDEIIGDRSGCGN
jgi:hypothetical protein